LSSAAVATAPALASRQDFASNVYHDLSQPLTALHCSLELALVRDQTVEEFRASVEAALQNAERLRQQLLLLRELSDAEDPGDVSPLALDRLLQQLREDMLPLFESAGRSFALTCVPVQVPANEAKLMRGFFYLLEFLLRCAAPGRDLCLQGRRTGQQQLEICIEGCAVRAEAGPSECSLDPDWNGGLEIARRTFRAIGGELMRMDSDGLPGVWMVRLPCVV
jgi:phospho-acceptor domain-containing protein